MIEDLPDAERSEPQEQGTVQPQTDKVSDRKKPTPRKSAVSAHVDPMAVST